MPTSFILMKERAQELKALQHKTGLSSAEDIFNSAMTLLEWAVDETIKGNQIVSLDPGGESYQAILMPILQRAAKQGNAASALSESELVLT
jgi:hypothetical protein